MLNRLLLFIFTMLSLSAFSQKEESFNYELIGSVVLESNLFYSYKIVFNKVANDSIYGYSFTDLGGEHETKSIITGKFNQKEKNFKFKEKDILYTKSTFPPDEFCYIQFNGKFVDRDRKKMLEGNFFGIYDDRDTCATGTVKLMSTKFIEKKLRKLDKKVARVSKIKKIDSAVVEEIKSEKILKTFSDTELKSGEKVTLYTYNNTLKFEIWDYGIQDGDVISLEMNGKMILDNYLVSAKKQTFSIDLLKKTNVIKIKTVNSGKLETNTTKLKFYDFRREYELLANLEEGKEAFINIIKLSYNKTKK